MAAKQGFSAQISQASEDARRAVLNRAPSAIKSSWLSNLNTTCTIKSAPPRTPEVMAMLATKSGWLVKRNEQHVWQRRWCCVVPHTFLYYFEAEPVLESDEDIDRHGDFGDGDGIREGFSGGGLYRSAGPVVVENQDLLNAAVKEGIRARSSTPMRDRRSLSNASGLGLSSDEILSSPIVVAPVRGPTLTNVYLSPVGIIDLECYTNINRSSKHDCVFELTGDPKTNPDLRSFYFQVSSIEDCDAWTKALLSDRHSALKDEREAYRQVCDSFQLQLQHLSDLIDVAEGKADSSEREVYTLRSTLEQTRKKVIDQIRESLDRKKWKSGESVSAGDSFLRNRFESLLETRRLNLVKSLDSITNGSLTATQAINNSVCTLSDYLSTIVTTFSELMIEVITMETKLSQTADIDKATLTDLERKIERIQTDVDDERVKYLSRIAELESMLKESTSTVEDTEKQMQTQHMEFTMFQSSAKSKLQELSQHKKILKKEVIDMRKKIDEIGSERDAALHESEKYRLQVETEKHKIETLEKYISKLESQVQVQQNMMEVMSACGLSQYGGSRGSRGSIRGSSSVVGKIIGPDISVGDSYSITAENNGSSDIKTHTKKSHRLPPSIGTVSARPLPVVDRSRSAPGLQSSPSRSPPRHNDHRDVDALVDLASPLSPTSLDSRRRHIEFDHHSQDSVSIESQELSRRVENDPNQCYARDEHYHKKEIDTVVTSTTQHSQAGQLDRRVIPVSHVDDSSEMNYQNDQFVKQERNDFSSPNSIIAVRSAEVESEKIIKYEHTVAAGKEKGVNSHHFCASTLIQKVVNKPEMEEAGSEESSSNIQHNDDDCKSHISELTEDRTFKATDVSVMDLNQNLVDSAATSNDRRGTTLTCTKETKKTLQHSAKKHPPSPLVLEVDKTIQGVNCEGSRATEGNFPPRYIIGSSNIVGNRLDESFRPVSTSDENSTSMMSTDNNSLSISVLQRSQSEQDQSVMSLRDKFEEHSTTSSQQQSKTVNKAQNMLSRLGGRLIEVVDSSVFAAKSDISTSDRKKSEETSLTLQQRMQLQRERQLEVLRQKGMIKDSDENITTRANSR